jgi:hypothetical protein
MLIVKKPHISTLIGFSPATTNLIRGDLSTQLSNVAQNQFRLIANRGNANKIKVKNSVFDNSQIVKYKQSVLLSARIPQTHCISMHTSFCDRGFA